MDAVKELEAIVYDIFRLPDEKLEALDGLARYNTPEVTRAITEIERNWALLPAIRQRARDIMTRKRRVV